MNTLPQLFEALVAFALAATIMICVLLRMCQQSALAKKFISWEFKTLAKIVRWFFRNLFQAIGDLFHYLAKECGQKKKNNNP
ncbi:MAG: hypothetical protein KGJ35_00720 [Patescibacteria group bacterium]|nr:hypothetical protein [Patescibacteria group bacterium]